MLSKKASLLEAVAWCFFLLCVSSLLMVKVKAFAASRLASHVETKTLDRETAIAGAVTGRLEISAIGLKVPIVEGFDPDALRAGIGHITGTAQPGGLGNMALAGHRDTFFRPLRHIRRGMKMSVFAADGRYDYMVDSMSIVKPEDVSVLSIHEKPELTLITCYPFEYVGSAPNRFIVRAHLASVVPSTREN